MVGTSALSGKLPAAGSGYAAFCKNALNIILLIYKQLQTIYNEEPQTVNLRKAKINQHR